MGQLLGLDAGQQIGALPDEEQALAQEDAQGAFVGRIDVRGREELERSRWAIFSESMRSFLFLPPWMALR